MYKKRNWTKEETQILIDNYHLLPLKELAAKLNRTVGSVTGRIAALGPTQIPNFRYTGPIKEWIYKQDLPILLDEYRGHRYKHRFQCIYCDNIFVANAGQVSGGYTKSCGCSAFGTRKGTQYISGSFFNARLVKNAQKRKIEFNLTIKYVTDLLIQQDFKCALTGRKLIYGYLPMSQLTISLDRIDSSKGYIEGNVQWVHKKLNIMKSVLSQEEFIATCQEVIDNYNRNILNANQHAGPN